MSSHQASRLGPSRILAYCLPAIPIAALSLPLSVFIPPLYAEHTTLSLNLIGTLFFVTRIFDVFTDPAFGFYSDRTRPSIGRRRFWMAASLPVLMISIWMLFNPLAEAGWLYLTFWLTAVYLGYTMSFISHLSWGAELSGLYDDRSRVLGWRQLAVNGGMLTVLVLPALLSLDGDSVERASAMGLYIVLALPLTFGVAFLTVPDPTPTRPAPLIPIRESLTALAHDPHLRRLLAAEFCLASALAITGSLYVWFAEDVWQLPDNTSLILLTYFGAAVISMPLWVRLAERAEKHRAFSFALFYGATTLALYLIVPSNSLIGAMAGSFLYGLAFGAGIFLARAMLADIAGADALEHGTPRMGIYFSTLTLTAKVGGAMGPFIAYNILGWAGYDPNAAVTPSGQAWLMATFIVPPALFLLAGGLIARKHKLTRAVHDEIRQQLEARDGADTSRIADHEPAVDGNRDAGDIA